VEYRPPWWLKNGHLQSIYPSLFRKVNDDFFERRRIDTSDGDFLDLDIAQNGHRRLVVLSHGLEGHSRRPYVLGMARAALEERWDVLAWNFRSCSGEPNRKLASYHSGQTQDLEQVVAYGNALGYDEIALVGFSIGGNKTLLYLGRDEVVRPDNLIGAVTFSVPVDLKSSAKHLAKKQNALYMRNFLHSFKGKLTLKAEQYPEALDLSKFKRIKTFAEYDNAFTAPLNGFENAEAYWAYSSSSRVLDGIQLPVLLVSALDDPFLTPECYPVKQVEHNAALTLEMPRYGGHVGFMSAAGARYWSERRAFRFLNKLSALE